MKESGDIEGIGKGAVRESNVEALRIICMLMVVVVHLDGGSLGLPDLEGDWNAMTYRKFWRLVVESFAFIGVNCFTLISGYFGIRLRWKGVLAFLYECVFYAVGIYIVMSILHRASFTWSGLADSALVLTHTDLWYVPAYFLLMLISPWLNSEFANMSRRNSLYLTLAFTGFTFWAGWWWGGKFNAAGYTAWQLVMMYCLGQALACYREELTSRNAMPLWGFAYIIFSVGTIILGVYDFRKAYSYNQPMVVAASISFFMFFVNLKIHSHIVSRSINYAARSAFAVYLIHKSPLIWSGWLRPLMRDLWNTVSLSIFTLWVIVIPVLFYIFAMYIDMIRRKSWKWISHIKLKHR